MPIIIPSKNIYGDPKIDIVRKNNIDAVEFKHFESKKDVVLNNTVYNAKDTAEPNTMPNSTRYDADYKTRGNPSGGIQSFSYSSFLPFYSGHLIRIPMHQKRETITDVFGGKAEGGDYNVSISYGGIMEKGTITCAIDFDYAQEENPDYADYLTMVDENSFLYTKESSEFIESFRSPTSVDQYNFGDASSEPKIFIEDRIETIEKDEEESTISVYETLVYSGYFLKRVGGTRVYSASNGVIVGKEEPVQVGEYEKFTPTQANISINGDKIVLNLNEVVSRFGNGTSVFEVVGNELMQDTNQISEQPENGIVHSLYVDDYANRIIKLYKNGKGTAEIECSIFPVLVGAIQSDFLTYDETINGISISKSGNSLVLNGTATDKTRILVSSPYLKADRYSMEIPTHQGVEYVLGHGEYGESSRFGDKNVYVDLLDFESVEIFVQIEKGTSLNNYVVGDIVTHESLIIPVGSSVIPMYHTASGDDYPMFSKSGGQPKPCIVVGAEVYYDGAVMQRLTIKEM